MTYSSLYLYIRVMVKLTQQKAAFATRSGRLNFLIIGQSGSK